MIDSNKGGYSEVTATMFCPELRQSLTEVSRECTPKHKKNMEKWLRYQFKTKQRNEQTKVETEAANTGEGNVVALYFLTNLTHPVYGRH